MGELTGPAVTGLAVLVLVPYASVIVVAAIFGAMFSGWYFPETGVFELVAVPLIVVIGATLVAGQLYSLATVVISENGTWVLKELFGFGLLASFTFIAASWLVLAPAAAIASYLMWHRYRYG